MNRKNKLYIAINVDNGVGLKVKGSHHLAKNIQVFELVGTDKQEVVLYSGELLASAQRVRDRHNRPLTLTSGHREITHNTEVGGSKNSEHQYGLAIDCKMHGISPIQLAKEFAEDLGYNCNIGTYVSWVHVGNLGYHRRHTY